MSEADAAQPQIGRDLEDGASSPAHDCAGSVLNAYRTALSRPATARAAFDTAVQTYLLYNPNLPEPAARRAVAQIISSKE
jgi:hypothetical protein